MLNGVRPQPRPSTDPLIAPPVTAPPKPADATPVDGTTKPADARGQTLETKYSTAPSETAYAPTAKLHSNQDGGTDFQTSTLTRGKKRSAEPGVAEPVQSFLPAGGTVAAPTTDGASNARSVRSSVMRTARIAEASSATP